MQAKIKPGFTAGRATVPTSKSMAHRAVLAAGLSMGPTQIDHLEQSQDIQASLRAIQAFGAMTQQQEDRLRVIGFGGPKAEPVTLDCGESASTLRFAIPVLALTGKPVTLTGHGRLMQRPLGPYQEIFRQQGLPFTLSGDRLEFCGPLKAGDYRLPGDVSSQFITGLLLALPLLEGDSRILVEGDFQSAGYVALTREVQSAFGVESEFDPENRCFRVPGGQHYRGRRYPVPGDYSQAAFLAVLGAVTGRVTLSGLSLPTTQPDAVILDILTRCGASVEWEDRDLTVSAAPLTATRIDLSDCPDLGPILMVLGLFCKGKTVIYNAGRLRLKESDRIAAMEAELRRFGAEIETTADTVTVTGGPLHAPERLCAHNDHRVIMALTVAALAAGVPACIDGAEAVAKSWPGFFRCLRDMGIDAQEDEA